MNSLLETPNLNPPVDLERAVKCAYVHASEFLRLLEENAKDTKNRHSVRPPSKGLVCQNSFISQQARPMFLKSCMQVVMKFFEDPRLDAFSLETKNDLLKTFSSMQLADFGVFQQSMQSLLEQKKAAQPSEKLFDFYMDEITPFALERFDGIMTRAIDEASICSLVLKEHSQVSVEVASADGMEPKALSMEELRAQKERSSETSSWDLHGSDVSLGSHY